MVKVAAFIVILVFLIWTWPIWWALLFILGPVIPSFLAAFLILGLAALLIHPAQSIQGLVAFWAGLTGHGADYFQK